MSERFTPTIRIEQAQRFIAIVDALNKDHVQASKGLFRLHTSPVTSLGSAMAAQLPNRGSGEASSIAVADEGRAGRAPSPEQYSPSIRVDHARTLVDVVTILGGNASEESMDAAFEMLLSNRVEMGNLGGALDQQMPRAAPRVAEPGRPSEPRPELPSEDLRWRVAGHRDADLFWETGQQSVDNINSMLAIIGTSIQDYARALDFGCGCGRVLLHMKEAAKRVELFGVDIDPDGIEWARKHIPWAKTSVNAWRPPLEFPDGYFDLIFNQSVFTHLDEDYQDVWLQELMRVTRPGAAVVLSVAGEGPFTDFVHTWAAQSNPSAHVEAFRNKGFVFISSDGWDDGPFPDFYHSAFHAPHYIYEHWGRYFDIKGYVARGSLRFLDYLLLIRRDGPARPLEKPAWDIGTKDPLKDGLVHQPVSVSQRAIRKVRGIAKGVMK